MKYKKLKFRTLWAIFKPPWSAKSSAKVRDEEFRYN